MPAVEELPPEAEEPVEALKESLGYLDSCIAQRNALEAQLKQTSEHVRPSLHLRPELENADFVMCWSCICRTT